jgi:hypothetical protein
MAGSRGVKISFLNVLIRSTGKWYSGKSVNWRRRKKHFTIQLHLDPPEIDEKLGQSEAKR